jgi:hypothetical protein
MPAEERFNLVALPPARIAEARNRVLAASRRFTARLA